MNSSRTTHGEAGSIFPIGGALVVLACLVGSSPFAYAGDAEFGNLDQLTLKQAEALMDLRNREIRSAQRATEAAQADTLTAGQYPNPTFSFDAHSINPSQGIGRGPLRDKNIDKIIRLEQTIERGNKQELRIEQAGHNETASHEDLTNTRRQQRLTLHFAYFDLRFAQEKARILREIAVLSAHSREAAQFRLTVGDIGKADVARIRVDAQRAANDARQAEAEITRAQLTLAALLGAEAAARRIRAIDSWPQPTALPVAHDIELAINERPDVRSAEARLAAAQAGARLARSASTRNVTVGVQYEHYPINPNFGTGNGNTYGVTASVPLFLWHENEGEIRRAEVARLAALDAVDKARAVARAELDRAWADLQEAAERVAQFQGPLLEDAKTAADAAEFAYSQGAVGLTDLLDARRTLRATQIEAALSHNDYAKARAAWQLASGDQALAEAPAGVNPMKDSVQ